VTIPSTERVALFRACLEAVRAQVHVTSEAGWPALLRGLVLERGIRRLLYGADGPLAPALRTAFAGLDGLALVSYAAGIEAWKEELFYGIDAAVTSSLGGVAETGSVILWPDTAEPRLMSLVPPVHFVLVDAGQIHATLDEAMRVQRWAERMPTNALLISGPSKSADIEQTIAYGVHGPKELVVIVTA
jgi:L-lactate dehydrogenase complex protein LldG